MNRSKRIWMLVPGLFLICALMLAGCGESRTPFVGTYKSDQPVSGKGHIELILRDSGEADWNWVDGNRTSKFKWRVQDGRVWLYTKDGAILIATPTDGNKYLSVDITGEWHEGCPTERCINFTRLK
jgi:hypothetical protein